PTALKLERVLQYDGFHTVGTGGNHINGHFTNFRNTLQVPTCIDRQFVVFGDTHGGLGPARHFFEHRLGFGCRMGTVGQDVQKFATIAIAHAKFNAFKAVEDVELGDTQAGDAIDSNRTFKCCTIKPPTTTRAPRDRTEFFADRRQALTDFVVEFGRERTRAYPRGIGLGDTQYVIECLGAYASTGRGRTRHAIAAGYVGIGAVINIQHGALRTFEQQTLTVFLGPMQVVGDVSHHTFERFSPLCRLILDGRGIDSLSVEITRQTVVVAVERHIQLLRNRRGIEEILDTQCPTSDLVFVGRADTTARSTDF